MGYLQLEILEAANECVGERLKAWSVFDSEEIVDSIEESRAVVLAGNRDQYRSLPRRTRGLLRRNKGRYIIGPAEMSSVI